MDIKEERHWEGEKGPENTSDEAPTENIEQECNKEINVDKENTTTPTEKQNQDEGNKKQKEQSQIPYHHRKNLLKCNLKLHKWSHQAG